MKKKLLFAALFCSALHAMDHEPNQLQLPVFAHFNVDEDFQLPGENNEYRYLTFDRDDLFFNPDSTGANSSVVLLSLHRNKPTGGVAFGRATQKDILELIGENSEATASAITGFDIWHKWPEEKAFALSRAKGWCTLMNFDDSPEGALVDQRITNDNLRAVYFESTRTVVCLSDTAVFRWNFTTGKVEKIANLTRPLERLDQCVIIPKNSLTQEPKLLHQDASESENDADAHEGGVRKWFATIARFFR